MSNKEPKLALPAIAILGVFALLPCTGCKIMSKAAYSVGSYLDPEQRDCIDHISDCEICGESSSEITDPAIHRAGYEMHSNLDPTQVRPAFDLSGEVQEIRALTRGLQEELDAVNTRLAARGNALIKTRAQLAKVQSDVGELRSDLTQWQASMRTIHRQINERDAERLATLSEMAASLKSVLSDNVRR